MFWKRLLLTTCLSILPLSLAQAGDEKAPAKEADAAAEKAEPASESTVKIEGTPFAAVLGDWDAGGGLVINLADDFLRLKKDGDTQDSPMKIKSQDGNKINLQLLDDKGKPAELVLIDILGKGQITLEWLDGDKKGKKIELWRSAAARAAKKK